MAAWVPPAAATPPGTNGQIAFASLRDGDFEIYVMNADGSPETNLTTDPGRLLPRLVPAGTKIAFTSERDGDPNIYVMNADGSGVVRLTDDPASDYDPTWSPDGSKILWTSQRDGDFELFIMYPDGSDETQVTRNGTFDFEAEWSPDGQRIAFATAGAADFEIATIRPDGERPAVPHGRRGRRQGSDLVAGRPVHRVRVRPGGGLHPAGVPDAVLLGRSRNARNGGPDLDICSAEVQRNCEFPR